MLTLCLWAHAYGRLPNDLDAFDKTQSVYPVVIQIGSGFSLC